MKRLLLFCVLLSLHCFGQQGNGRISPLHTGSGSVLNSAAIPQVSEAKHDSPKMSTSGQVYNAMLFPGTDIGMQANAAIAAAGCGVVEIPAGSYRMTTSIHVPHCITLRGQRAATKILWTGSGAALIASSANAPGQYFQGHIEGLEITGDSKAGQVGLYQGGDPACTGSCVTNPAALVGYSYIVKDLTIYNMDKGVVWGNSAYNIEWDNVISSGNLTYGWYYPSTSGGGGQNNHFYHSQFQSNASGAWLIQQSPFVTFEMMGMDIQYNVGNFAPTNVAEVQGGHVLCIGCHFEHQQGPFIFVGASDDIRLIGGQLISVKRSVDDPYLVRIAGAGYFGADGTYLVNVHNVGYLIDTAGASSPHVAVFNTNIYSVGQSFGGVIDPKVSGAGINYDQPIDPATQVPNVYGASYRGGRTTFDSIVANRQIVGAGYVGTQNDSPLALRKSDGSCADSRDGCLPSRGTYIGGRHGATGDSSDFYNATAHPADTSAAFEWFTNVDGTATRVASVSRSGTISGSGFQVNDRKGFTGTRVIDGTTFTIEGGIITNVSP